MKAVIRAGLIGAAGLLISGCGTPLLRNTWDPGLSTQPARDAADSQHAIPTNDKRLLAMFTNDGEQLHIVVVTGDEGLRRLVQRIGLTFWFDAAGGKEKTFGFRYPVHAPWPTGTPPEQGGDRFDARSRSGSFTADEVEICGPGDEERHPMTLAETGGIGASMRRERDSLVIELTVPLADNGKHPFSIGTKPGALIGFGIETEKARPSAMSSRMGMEGTMTPRDRGDREPGGFGERRRGGGRMDDSNADGGRGSGLNVWAKLQLASGTAPTQ